MDLEGGFDFRFDVGGTLRDCVENKEAVHIQPMLAFCQPHQSFICPFCMTTSHRDCSDKLILRLKNYEHPVITQPELFKELKKVSEKIKKRIEEWKNQKLNASKSLDDAIAAMKDINQRIDDFSSFVVKTVKELVDSYKAKQLQINEEITKELSETKEKIMDEVNYCDEALNKCDEYTKTIGDIHDLVDHYESLRKYFLEIAAKDLSKYNASIQSYKKRADEINYSKDFTIDKIDQCVQKLWKTNSPVQTEQTDSQYLYRAVPLSNCLKLYNLSNNTISVANLMLGEENFTIPYGASTLLSRNEVVITGGTTGGVAVDESKAGLRAYFSSECYSYAILFDRVAQINGMVVPRSQHTMIEKDNVIFALGGINEGGYLTSCEILAHSGSWEEIRSLNEPRALASALTLDAFVYVFAGLTPGRAEGVVERINAGGVLDAAWEVMGVIRDFSAHSLGVIEAKHEGSKGVYIFGGVQGQGEALKEMFFMERQELGESGDKTLKKVQCEFAEEGGLFNAAPQKRANEVWAVGSNCLYCLPLDNDRKLKWYSVND